MAKKELFSPKIEKIDREKHKISSGKLKAIILSLVIAIVLAFFVGYLIQAIKPGPKYEDYCGKTRTPIPIEKEVTITQAECEANNGTWSPYECVTTPCTGGYCDFYYECNQEFEKAQDNYNLVVFIVAVVVGLIAVTAGIILSLPSVSLGLMLGGAFLTIYGSARYWYKLSNWIRVILLGIVLAILIWLGYKKLKN